MDPNAVEKMLAEFEGETAPALERALRPLHRLPMRKIEQRS